MGRKQVGEKAFIVVARALQRIDDEHMGGGRIALGGGVVHDLGAALELAQVLAFDAGRMGQVFLTNAALRALCARGRPECLGGLGREGRGASRSAALDGTLLHRQKRRLARQLKPR